MQHVGIPRSQRDSHCYQAAISAMPVHGETGLSMQRMTPTQLITKCAPMRDFTSR